MIYDTLPAVGPAPLVMPAPVPISVPQPIEKGTYLGRRTPVASRTYYVYPDGSTSDVPPPSRMPTATLAPAPMLAPSVISAAPPATTLLPTRPTVATSDPNLLSPLHAAEAEIARLVSERDTLLNDNRRLHQELINARSACATHVHYGQTVGENAEDYNTLKQRVRQLEVERDDLQGRLSVSGGAPWSRDNAALLAELDDSRKERTYLQNELARSEDTIRMLQRSAGKAPLMADAEVNALINSERAAREEVGRLQRALDTLRGETSSFSQTQEDLRNAEKEIAMLTQDRNELEKELQQAQQDFDELSAQFNALTATVGTAGVAAAAPAVAAAAAAVSPRPLAAAPMQQAPVSPTPIGVGRRRFPPNLDPAPAYVEPVKPQVVYTKSGEMVNAGPAGNTRSHELCFVLGMQVTVQENSPNPQDGIVEITAIAPGSLAERSGLRLNDIVEKWNRKVILSVGDWEKALQESAPGSTIRVGVMRTGTRKQIMINLP